MSQYLCVHQTRTTDPTAYENLLADGIERAYAAGIYEIEPLVAMLNQACVPSPNGQAWTAASFKAEMARLGG